MVYITAGSTKNGTPRKIEIASNIGECLRKRCVLENSTDTEIGVLGGKLENTNGI